VADFKVFYLYLPGETDKICWNLGPLEYETRVTLAYKMMDRVENRLLRFGIYYRQYDFLNNPIYVYFL